MFSFDGKRELEKCVLCGESFCLLSARKDAPLGSKPSQALPRQLSQRESQAVKVGAKVLGVIRKLPEVHLALPLGELAKPTGFD